MYVWLMVMVESRNCNYCVLLALTQEHLKRLGTETFHKVVGHYCHDKYHNGKFL